MASKTILFGAGPGALTYMQNNLETLTFIGFADNDPSKQGTVINGLPVYGPEHLARLDFDQVVITTQWSLPVSEQLVSEVGLDPDKVVIPEKNQLKQQKPFADPENTEIAEQLVFALMGIAVRDEVPLVVDFGTLLGIVRDNGIIPWDDDVDLSAPQSSAAQIEDLLNEALANSDFGRKVRMRKGANKEGRVTGYWIDIFPGSKGLPGFTASICLREFIDGKALHMPSLGMWYSPEEHFLEVERISWKNRDVLVPFNAEAYLEFQYGDWKTPKQNIQLTDYANLNTVTYSDIKAAEMTIDAVYESK